MASKRMTTWSHRWFANCSKRAKWANQPMQSGLTSPTSARRCLRRLQPLSTEEQEEPATDSNVPLDESGAFAFDAAEEEASEVEEAEPLPEMAKPFLVPPLVPVSVPEPAPAPTSQTNVLAFNAMRPKAHRRKPVAEDEEQMLLFG